LGILARLKPCRCYKAGLVSETGVVSEGGFVEFWTSGLKP
jgi:hypothetical protein